MLSVPGFIAFVNTWLSKNRNLSEIDNNSGVVPDEWIQEIKAAVTNIYGDLEGESLTSKYNDLNAAECKKEIVTVTRT